MDIAKYAVHVSERGPEKNTSREKTRQDIWEGSTAHSLKSFPTKAWRLYGSKVSTYIYQARIPT